LKICFQPASPPSRLGALRQMPYPNSDAYTVVWSAGSSWRLVTPPSDERPASPGWLNCRLKCWPPSVER
jgi:hypothetical protein